MVTVTVMGNDPREAPDDPHMIQPEDGAEHTNGATTGSKAKKALAKAFWVLGVGSREYLGIFGNWGFRVKP